PRAGRAGGAGQHRLAGLPRHPAHRARPANPRPGRGVRRELRDRPPGDRGGRRPRRAPPRRGGLDDGGGPGDRRRRPAAPLPGRARAGDQGFLVTAPRSVTALRGPRLAGASAVVTGGGSGIGAALCRALVAAGAHVVVADIDLAAARRVAEEVTTTRSGPGAGSAGAGSAEPAHLDVTDAAAVAALVEEVVSTQGGLDLMFANAGITWGGDTDKLTLEQWNAIIDVNVRGVVHCVHAAYPHMIDRGAG